MLSNMSIISAELTLIHGSFLAGCIALYRLCELRLTETGYEFESVDHDAVVTVFIVRFATVNLVYSA